MEKMLRALLPGGIFIGVAAERSRRMAAVRGKGNRTTEVRARAMLVAAGLRGWCIHPTDVEGRPDFYFPLERLAAFIDGCFWHGCPRCGHVPRTNSRFWAAKIERNRDRDRRTSRLLRRQGMQVVRVWEHDVGAVVGRVREILACCRTATVATTHRSRAALMAAGPEVHMAKFKEGQIVTLKSGGPKMTVMTDATQGAVHCHWFGGKKLEHGIFREGELELVANEPGPKPEK